MARISIELEDGLLAEASRILETRTHPETVETALREVIAMRRRLEAMERLRVKVAEGAIDIEYLSDKANYRPKPKIYEFPQD
jgi:Arc/MetJ family transcription regulator